MSPILLTTLLALGCGPEDADADQFSPPLDCDDGDAGVHPGAPETCDGRDENCDGAVDEGAPADAPTWYADLDGDAAGTAALSLVACTAPAGWAATADDCDDADPAVHPGAPEVCGNGLDDNCDGLPGDCRLTGRMSAADADAVLIGPWLAATGLQVDLADLTGDGRMELLAGEPDVYGDGGCESALYAVTWPFPAPVSYLADAATRWCDEEMGGLGTDLAVADVDGDGVVDLVVTSPQEEYANPSEGLVLAWYGPVPMGRSAWWTAGTLIYGGTGSYEYGTAAAAGDFDADGLADLAVSMPFDDDGGSNAGAFDVFPGPVAPGTRGTRGMAALTIVGDEAGAYLGMRLFTLPDMDGDGGDELAVASPHADTSATDAGEVRVFSGLLTGDDAAADADFTVQGTQASEGLGWTGDAGDLDGDGRGDLVLGSAWGGDGSGVVLAWLGPLAGVEDALPNAADLAITGTEAAGHLGVSVGVDDVDGDGQDDLLVGTNSIGEGVDPAGFLLVYYGPLAGGSLTAADADLVIAGVEPEGWFGYGEPRAGDVDGDGVPDLVIAAPLADLQGPGSDSGALYVLRGQGW